MAILSLNTKWNTILTEFKGALTEQFVCQQLCLKTTLFYWTATNAMAEVDFIIQTEKKIGLQTFLYMQLIQYLIKLS